LQLGLVTTMDATATLRDADLGPETRVRRAEWLYAGLVDGRRFVHNPRGFEALAVLSDSAAALLDHADGSTLAEIATRSGRPLGRLLAELPMLGRNGFVVGPGVPALARPAPSPPRFDLWVHVTNACNLDCPYCYIEKDAHSLGDDTAAALQASLLRTVRDRGLRGVNLRFAGGEPMLRWAFLQRFFDDTRALLAREGCTLTAAILTNATRIPADAPAWLVDRGVGVSVSIDGVGAVQDAMRPAVGGAGSWDAVVRGVDRLQAGGVHPYALVTVTRDNLHGMPDLTRWLLDRAMGFRYSLVRDLEGGQSLMDARSAGWRTDGKLVQLRRPDRPEASALASRSPMLEGEALVDVLKVFGECYDLIEARVPVPGLSFRKTHRFCDLEWRRPITKACAAGEGSLAIGHDGQISPCQAALHHEGTATLASDTNLAALAPRVSQLGDFRRKSPNSACSGCRFRWSCAGGCPLLLHRRDGHLDGQSPYCEVFRAVLPRILRIAARELIAAPPRRPHPPLT